jgi:hypothetical protein
MNIRRLVEYVYNESEGQPSREDQVRAIVVMSQYGYQRSGALTQREIADHASDLNIEFDHALGTVLSNLYDKDVLSRFTRPGPDWYVISQRRDEVINGEFEENVESEHEALIDHIQDEDPAGQEDDTPMTADGGQTLREAVAQELEVVPDGLEAYLRGGESGDQRERLNNAIDAVTDHDEFEKRDSYGKILLKPAAYRYHFSALALILIDE